MNDADFIKNLKPHPVGVVIVQRLCLKVLLMVSV